METTEAIIDVHVHIFPERMFKAIWKYFENRDWVVHHENIEEMQKTLSAHGVSHAAALSYPHKLGVAESLNAFMESVGRTNTMFLPFASVYPDDEDFRQYVDRALDSPNLHGFKFQPLVQKFDVNRPDLDYLYEQCVERDVPIVMHIGSGPYANEYVGLPHFRKLMKRFEELRICVPHMGVPEYDDFLLMLDDYPNMFLDTTMINTPTDVFDTSYTGDPELLMRHPDRICFGSDWPNVPYSYHDAIHSLDRFGLSPSVLRNVMYENPVRFLKLKFE